ncbi:DUF6895 family protein [Streptomyces minutiscleroticus]|uniref:DUF6895 domain-containing protein n=1 Tax=Streptomyces minutiscleroticus TaxID=68238 RepID=A0A918KSS8_9ACTN|nr:hypothetical protein GCM10010358_29260 [Streptomyces minutiscleroticus]
MRAPDVTAVGEAALGWLSANRDGFRLGDEALAAHGSVNRTWKPLGELAQVCVCVLRHTDPASASHRAASDLLAFAWRQTGQGALFPELQRLEPFATYHLEVYAAFAAAGLRSPAYEEAAAVVARTRGWQVTEQDPNRRMSVLNSERRAGLAPHGELPAALRRTWLGGLPEPWSFERSAGYTLTHVIYHLTDWGLAPDAVPPHVAAYLDQWLPAWLDTCLEDEQWDLGCELLAVAAALPRLPDGDTLARAWEGIAAAQKPDGSLAELGPGRYGRTVPEGFRHCYHSSLMAAFAAALTAGRRHEDTAGGTGGAAGEDTADGGADRTPPGAHGRALVAKAPGGGSGGGPCRTGTRARPRAEGPPGPGAAPLRPRTLEYTPGHGQDGQGASA